MLSNFWKGLLISFLIQGCIPHNSDDTRSVQDELTPSLVALTVKNLNITTNWYVENLGFELDSTMSFPAYQLKINLLILNGFKLELIGFEDAKEIKRDLLPNEYSNVHGFIKLGFLTDNLETVISQMELSDVDVIAGPAVLPPLKSGRPWPERFYLVKDPDGVYVQFFEASEMLRNEYEYQGKISLSPFLAMISVESFEQSIEWYKQLGFQYLEGVETTGNQRGLLSTGNFILEVGSFDSDRGIEVLNVPEDDQVRLVRMSKLGFSIQNADSLHTKLVQENYSFYYENMEGEEPNFIIRDSEGNYLQFFKR